MYPLDFTCGNCGNSPNPNATNGLLPVSRAVAPLASVLPVSCSASTDSCPTPTQYTQCLVPAGSLKRSVLRLLLVILVSDASRKVLSTTVSDLRSFFTSTFSVVVVQVV